MGREYFSRKQALILFTMIVYKYKGLDYKKCFDEIYMENLLYCIYTNDAHEIARKINEHFWKLPQNKFGRILSPKETAREPQTFLDFQRQLKEGGMIFVSDVTLRRWKSYIGEPNFDTGFSMQTILRSNLIIRPDNSIDDAENIVNDVFLPFRSGYSILSKRNIYCRSEIIFDTVIKDYNHEYFNNNVLKSFINSYADKNEFKESIHLRSFDLVINQPIKYAS